MKIRNGFVSNSSSSSFIILLPKSFVLSDKVIEKKIKAYVKDEITLDISIEQIKKAFNKLKRNRCYGESDDYSIMYILMNILEEFEITNADSSECCMIELVNKKKIKEILKK